MPGNCPVPGPHLALRLQDSNGLFSQIITQQGLHLLEVPPTVLIGLHADEDESLGDKQHHACT